MGEREQAAIYIHIPFCKSKCFYCDFVSWSHLEDQHEAYKNVLLNEIRNCDSLKQVEISSIFIGGGTPTVFSPHFIAELLEELSNYKIHKNAEITIEANPGTLSLEMLRVLKANGINRLSMGLQAWQNPLLKEMGRIHSVEQFLENYNNAVKTGFENINIDLMFSLPNQTLFQWEETITNVCELKPKHISTYSLILEEGTRFYDLYRENRLVLADDELDREMYYFAKEYLKKDYVHYEISNFAKKGFESKHNIIYWSVENYLGFGLNSHSYFRGVRFNNTDNLELYIKNNGDRKLNTMERSELTKKEKMEEFMFLGLRLLDGIEISKFRELFNEDIFSVYGQQIDKCIGNGLLEKNHRNIYLTSKGIDLSNMVFSEFI